MALTMAVEVLLSKQPQGFFQVGSKYHGSCGAFDDVAAVD